MSTIRVDNFGPSSGGTTYSARGIAKAWVNFDGTGTIAARDSENVSSLTDNGTGDYTVNIGNDFAAADYATAGGGGRNSDAEWRGISSGSLAVGSCKISSSEWSGSNVVKTDVDTVTAAFLGDLA